MFSDFKFQLERSARRSGAGQYLEKNNILQSCRQYLEEFFDGEKSENFEVLSYKEGNLKIACLFEEDALRLREQEQSVIEKINRNLDKGRVRSIMVLT